MKALIVAALIVLNVSILSTASACPGKGSSAQNCGKKDCSCSHKGSCDGACSKGSCGDGASCHCKEKSEPHHGCQAKGSGVKKEGYSIAANGECAGDVDCCCWGKECLGNPECCSNLKCAQ